MYHSIKEAAELLDKVMHLFIYLAYNKYKLLYWTYEKLLGTLKERGI